MKQLLYTILLCCVVQAAFSQEPEKKNSIPEAMRQPGVTSKQKDKVKHQSGDTKVKDTKNCCCEEEESDCTEMTCSLRKQGLAKDIVYDFKSKDIKLPNDWRKLKKGDWLRLKVMNYNPYLYKLVIDHKDSSVAAVNDGKLLGWFLDPANLGGIVANIVTKVKDVPPMVEPLSLYKQAANYEAVIDNRDEIMKVIQKEDPVADTVGKKIVKPTTEDSIEIVQLLQVDQRELIKAKNEAFDEQKNKIEKKLYDISRKFALLRTLYPDCNKFKYLIPIAEIQQIETDMSSFRKKNSMLLDDATNNLNTYNVAGAPYMKLIAREPKLNAADELIRQFYKELAIKVAKIDSAINYKNMGDIIARLETAALLRSCYTSFPLQVTDDVKKINIEFKPRFDSLGLPAYNSQLLLPLVQHKIWGVSSGIHVSLLRNQGFVNKTIPKVQTGADSVYVLTADGQGDVQMGINALAYVGWKGNRDNDKPNYWGISFGAGMSLESKPKPRVLLGGSFITGEKNRIVFTLGLIGGQVSKLSKGYEAGAAYTKPATDFLKDVMTIGGFFSINYSFLSK